MTVRQIKINIIVVTTLFLPNFSNRTTLVAVKYVSHPSTLLLQMAIRFSLTKLRFVRQARAWLLTGRRQRAFAQRLCKISISLRRAGGELLKEISKRFHFLFLK
jgi:hypothetical protein